MSMTGFTGIRLGTMQTTALNNSTSVTITPDADADFIMFEVVTHDARITFDGSEPTTTRGFKLTKDTPYRISVGLMTTIKVIAIENNPTCYWQAFRLKRDDNA